MGKDRTGQSPLKTLKDNFQALYDAQFPRFQDFDTPKVTAPMTDQQKPVNPTLAANQHLLQHALQGPQKCPTCGHCPTCGQVQAPVFTKVKYGQHVIELAPGQGFKVSQEYLDDQIVTDPPLFWLNGTAYIDSEHTILHTGNRD